MAVGVNSLPHEIPDGLSETETQRFTFCGILDGNGKVIFFDGDPLESSFLQSNYGTIKNLTVSYFKDDEGLQVSFVGDNYGLMQDVSFTTIYNGDYSLYSFVGAPLCVNNYGTISAKRTLAASGFLSFVGEGAGICMNNYGTIANVVSDFLYLRSAAGDYSISGIAANNFGKIEKCIASGLAFGSNAYENSSFYGIACRNRAGAEISDCVTAVAMYVLEYAAGACYINEGLINNFNLCKNVNYTSFAQTYYFVYTGGFSYYYSFYSFLMIDNIAGVAFYNSGEGTISNSNAGGFDVAELVDEVSELNLFAPNWSFYVADLIRIGGICFYANGNSLVEGCGVRFLYGSTGGGLAYEMSENAAIKNSTSRCLNVSVASQAELIIDGEFAGAVYAIKDNVKLEGINTTLTQFNGADSSENNFKTQRKLAGLVFYAEDEASIENCSASVWAVANEVAGLCYDFGGKIISNCGSKVQPANFGMDILAQGCVYLRNGSVIDMSDSSESFVTIGQLNTAGLCAFVIYNYGTIKSLYFNHESNADDALSLFAGRWGVNEVTPEVSAVVAAHNYGTVRDIVVNVVYNAFGESNWSFLPQYSFIKSSQVSGGVVGINYDSGVVENCSVYGISVISDTFAGGIAGQSLGGGISDCYVDLCVAQAPSAGGIVGSAKDTAILKSVVNNNFNWQGEEYSDLSVRYSLTYGNIAGSIDGGEISDCAFRSVDSGKTSIAADILNSYTGNGAVDWKRYESDVFASEGLAACFENHGLTISENLKKVCKSVESRLLAQEKEITGIGGDKLLFAVNSSQTYLNGTKNVFLSYYVWREVCSTCGENSSEAQELEELLKAVDFYEETVKLPETDRDASAEWFDDMTTDELMRFLTITSQFNEWFVGLRSRLAEIGNYYYLAPSYSYSIGFGVVKNLKPFFRNGLNYVLEKLSQYDSSMGLKSEFIRACIYEKFGSDSEMALWFKELCASGELPVDVKPCGIDYMRTEIFTVYFKDKLICSADSRFEDISEDFLMFIFDRYSYWDTNWSAKRYALVSSYLDWAVKGIYGSDSVEYDWWLMIKAFNTRNWIDVAGVEGVKYYLTTDECLNQLGNLSSSFKSWLNTATDMWDESGLLSKYLSEQAASAGYSYDFERMRNGEGIYYSWIDRTDKQTIIDFLKYSAFDELIIASSVFYNYSFGSERFITMLSTAIDNWDGNGLLSEYLLKCGDEGITYLYMDQYITSRCLMEVTLLYFSCGPQ